MFESFRQRLADARGLFLPCSLPSGVSRWSAEGTSHPERGLGMRSLCCFHRRAEEKKGTSYSGAGFCAVRIETSSSWIFPPLAHSGQPGAVAPGAVPTKGFFESFISCPQGSNTQTRMSPAHLCCWWPKQMLTESVPGSEPSAFPLLSTSGSLEVFYSEHIPRSGCSSSAFLCVNFH